MRNKTVIKLLSILLSFIFTTMLYAGTVVLKSGQTVEGKIVERSDEYIKINCYGVHVTYFLDDIETIDGERPIFSRANPEESHLKETAYSSKQNNNPLADEKCFLWEIKSAQSTIYILGSIHVGIKEMYPLKLKIIDAFNKSDLLVLETKPPKDPVEFQQTILKCALLPEGETLRNNLSKEILELLETKLAQFNIPISSIENYRPWFLSMRLEEIALQRLGYYPLYGIDYYFFKKAEDREKPVLELESLEYQAKIFNTLTKEQQELFLYSTLINLDGIKNRTAKMIEIWQKGDVETLEFLSIGSILLGDPRLLPVAEKVIYERNKNMVIKIEEYLKTGRTYFIIVGSQHLIGKKGIIELLKNKKYTVRQL